jgi:peptide chain release factor 1
MKQVFFAGDLFRMYTKYCEEVVGELVVDMNEGTSGGFKG